MFGRALAEVGELGKSAVRNPQVPNLADVIRFS